MEAVIATGGKQYRVAPGQVIKVERLGKPAGASVEFNQVLLVTKDGQVTAEPQALTGAKVTGESSRRRRTARSSWSSSSGGRITDGSAGTGRS